MMTNFIDWFQALPPYMRAYWTIAIATSIIFLIQMALTLIGLGDTAAILCGCIMVCAFIIMYRQLMKLEGNGSYRIEESVGQVCEVYLRIPGQRSGSGKVQISFHGSVQELPAQTEGDAIPSGTKVRVEKVIDKAVLIVAPL